MSQDPAEEERTTRPWQPRFGIGSLLLVMLVFSVMAAAGSYFARSLDGQTRLRPTFILFTLVAPVALLVVVSVARGLWNCLRGSRRP
jgi:hypothetical protein